MKRVFFISIVLFSCSIFTYGQQWVDKQYDYDSMVDVFYGTAINFTGETDSLLMDVYLPVCADSTASSLRPLVVFVHGGGFVAGSKNDASIQQFCKDFAQRGYVTAAIDYRLGFIADDKQHQCNFPDYNCFFATDSAEWIRAYYRGVQDAKGALRWLANRQHDFRIDIDNFFLVGESAGAFIALGAGLLDTLIEKPQEASTIADAPRPHISNMSCFYNEGHHFPSANIFRPDLGDIKGSISLDAPAYTIKGLGNFFGGMFSNLLEYSKSGTLKPAIYSFHQPCDIVVPIDSNYVYWGLSWCFTNGYNCYGISNNKTMIYGSRTFSQWNSHYNYGYDIVDDFTSKNFPYSFLLGEGSCLDQVSNPCHAIDNRTKREDNMALFFAEQVSTPTCETIPSAILKIKETHSKLDLYPNPTNGVLNILSKASDKWIVNITDMLGRSMLLKQIATTKNSPYQLQLKQLQAGFYIINMSNLKGDTYNGKIIIRD